MKKIVAMIFVLILVVSALATELSVISEINNEEKVKETQNISFYPTMSYQGLLKDSNNELIEDGVYKITFKIYDGEKAEADIWKEIQEVEITNGIINCFIGAEDKLDLPFDKQYWLSVGVNDDELPRMIMSGTPYSLHARRIAEDAIVGGKNISVSKDEDGKIVLSGDGTASKTATNLNDGTSTGSIRMATNNISSGYYSASLGFDTDATGSSAFSMGYQNLAEGQQSCAIGRENFAQGSYSFAAGYKSRAAGNSSTALGNNSNALADYSFASGIWAMAEGDYSTSMGRCTQANGISSIALGSYSFAENLYSCAIGWNAKANEDRSFALGTHMTNEIPNSFMVGFNYGKNNPHYSSPTLYADSSRVCIGLSEANILSAQNIHDAVLHVNGDMYATKIIVQDENDNWPDYVFEDDYKLRTLNEVSEFVNSNKHLPDVPSAKYISKSGNDLGKMDQILLRKIEEMTLYMIDQEKRIKELENGVKK